MILFPSALLRDAENLLDTCRKKHLKLATAESCTGGLISALLTEIPGSSDVFTHGFITYANAAKQEMIGVPEKLIQQHGAVSAEVATAMAEGALRTARVDLAVAVTGVAGPAGGTPQKPLGMVCIAAAAKGKPTLHHEHHFKGDRSAVRLQSVDAALHLVGKLIRS